MNIVVVYGPGGCGKSHHKNKLAAALDCGKVVDGWTRADGYTKGALHLANTPLRKVPSYIRQISFNEACAIAGIPQDNRTMQDDS